MLIKALSYFATSPTGSHCNLSSPPKKTENVLCDLLGVSFLKMMAKPASTLGQANDQLNFCYKKDIQIFCYINMDVRPV